ncbi:enoyl-CoA hydratase/isomerase family protein [Alicyclobacillus acidocaldarius]|uniref:3-hydroxyisobutyryl-CoA hydrolase n=1 Tax=Alicyclobacillus acidocaldarius subsp. acidocaldarius (strain ATCC 27009 / DSM 446 / BCRC 14685 / JCM 5260 / KCTC 1825 / NBRC 15652 / NCIMB 11725 / NRRL B-14509 / 104-IA) TaxID=521098 RepID=C8WWK9_ALIAD|nr:enoyl-CoA hydratase/isomerase family protein [Alicyclobacillus acidocaldarius]ACV58480.1 Enoyl-CoA hydratase/isomerase [Alicyclobacillus acidocaldarius subsp. acidocaldarius DSM 446]
MDSVLFRQTGTVAWLGLNRPKQLNALSLEMIRLLRRHLDEMAQDPSVELVVLYGEGDRAFCAGGDIRALYDAKDEPNLETAAAFFSEEYALDDRVARFPKPVVALWDGIVMGGGVGLTYGATWKVATDRTRFAMPETGIGFFPDVGMCHALSRMQGGLGHYLALTGESVGADVLLAAGLANGWLPSGERPSFEAELVKRGEQGETAEQLQRWLAARLAVEHRPSEAVADFLRRVQAYFDSPSLSDILARLREGSSRDPFAAQALEILRQRSPLSLAVTFEALRRAGNATYREVLETDLTLALQFIRRGDFVEGVRAQLVDKDRRPRWRHADLASVTAEEVEAFFEPIAHLSIPFAD